MSSAAKSVFGFGIYIAFMGLSLIFIPGVILPPFGFAVPQEVWVRVLGLLALALSSYYFLCARENVVPFFRMSVWGRAGFGIGMIILGLVTPGSLGLVAFALVDLAGAAWTWWALRQP
ncbi:MAG: hypothetical protein U0694_19125 [Anaerolineae bacterium]